MEEYIGIIDSAASDPAIMERATALWAQHKPPFGWCQYMATMLAANTLSKEKGLPFILCLAYLKKVKRAS
jgi:hypothetical protein